MHQLRKEGDRMGIIDNEIQRMRTAIYGEDMRDAIGDAMEILNTDHTIMSNLVNQTNINALLLCSEIPNTIQTITFDSKGNVSGIVHMRSNETIREDTFTFGSGEIVEERKLSTGECLTITTDITSLESVIVYTEVE